MTRSKTIIQMAHLIIIRSSADTNLPSTFISYGIVCIEERLKLVTIIDIEDTSTEPFLAEEGFHRDVMG